MNISGDNSASCDLPPPRPPICIWPPTRWPPIEPEPDVNDLGEDVDWMTYSHAELYQMATEGVAAEAALEVADEWSRLGEALDEIGADLRKAMARCEEGWSGEAAELARETGRGLGGWSAETGKRAMNACVCVQQQAENARVAAQKMRELPPPPTPRLMPAQSTPATPVSPEQAPTGATSAMSASPFTGGGFEGAREMIVAPWPDREERQERHRQAADVMREFQRGSYEVYQAAPEFVPPEDGRFGTEGEDPERKPDKPEQPEQPEPDDGRTVAAGDAPAGGPAAGAGGAAGAAAPPREVAGRGAPFGVGAGSGAVEAPAQRSGVAAPGAGAPGTAAAPGVRGGAGVAGMPMGAAGAGGGAQRGEDLEHKAPSYLSGEDDLFETDETVVPPVIGDDTQR